MEAAARPLQPARGLTALTARMTLALILALILVASASTTPTATPTSTASPPSSPATTAATSTASPATFMTSSALLPSPPLAVEEPRFESPPGIGGLHDLNLTAYDCAHPDTKRGVVDLVTLPDCPPPPVPPTPKAVTVRVLLARFLLPIHVYFCRVNITTDHLPCNESSKIPSRESSEELLGRDGCKKLYQSNLYVGNGVSLSAKANSSASGESYPLSPKCRRHCPAWDLGSCSLYKVVKKTVTVTLEDRWEFYNRGADLLFARSLHESRPYKDMYSVVGGPEGEAIWDPLPEEDQCGDQHAKDVLYEGDAFVTPHPTDNSTHVVFTDRKSNKTISYRLGARTQFCQDEAYPANGDVNVVVVFKTPAQNFSFASSSLPVSILDADRRLPTTEGWPPEDNWSRLNKSMVDHFQQQLKARAVCLENRRRLHARLAVARASAGPVAALDGLLAQDADGLRGVVAGGVLHLEQCVPVAVRLRAAQCCYQEVPVVVVASGAEAFMTSPGGVLVSTGREVACDPLAPPMHRLAGDWFAFEPAPRRVMTSPGSDDVQPSRLLPEVFALIGSGKQLPVEPVLAVRPAGKRQLTTSADAFESSVLRASLLSAMAARVQDATGEDDVDDDEGDDSGGVPAWKIFSEADWAKVAETVAERSSLRRFAVGVSVFLGLAVLAVAAKAVAQALAFRRLLRVDSWRLGALAGLSPGLLVAWLLEPQGTLGGERIRLSAAGEANANNYALLELPLLRGRGGGSVETLRSRAGSCCCNCGAKGLCKQ